MNNESEISENISANVNSQTSESVELTPQFFDKISAAETGRRNIQGNDGPLAFPSTSKESEYNIQ
jgi:hypothetical protein